MTRDAHADQRPAPPTGRGATHVELRGAATHNLRHVDCDVPLGRVTVVTGVSGSGKSSLAVDTLYAEAQRRFMTSLSAYARQFLERLERPPLERLDFVPPAIAIGQHSRPTSARSSVGSLSQVSDLLQLLYGAAASAQCPNGHGPLGGADTSRAAAALVESHSGRRAIVVARVRRERRSFASLIRDGYARALDADGAVATLDADDPRAEVRVVVDRLKLDAPARLAEAIGRAYALADGRAELVFPDGGEPLRLAEATRCGACGFEAPPREARLFSPTSAIGACPTCEGFGREASLDLGRVVPDPTKSLLEDAIAPWSTPAYADWKDFYHRLAKRRGLDLKRPWHQLTDAQRALVLDGDPALQFPGVRGFFAHLETKRYKMSARILIARYRTYVPCSQCGGAKLRPGALAYRLGDASIAELHQRPIEALGAHLDALALDPGVEPLRQRLRARLRLLDEIGLGYLTLGREGRTLSSGEARRLHLSTALGAGVTGTLYVLDEPSVGLHARDTERLAGLLRALADGGNTVVVVEHDLEIIRRADHVLELGPGAGRRGGHVVFAGAPDALARADTATGRVLRGERERDLASPRAGAPDDVPAPRRGRGAAPRGSTAPAPPEPEPRARASGAIELRGARARTLRGLDLTLPLGGLVAITGVSGSGKSTLVHEVLIPSFLRAKQGLPPDRARLDALLGADRVDAIEVVDTNPLARSARSIPATYLDAWSEIRKVLVESADAKRIGLEPGDFSFNAAGGRCETCQGLGTVTVDMQFLDDVTMVCEACQGRRFKARVLAARWRGLDVAELLERSIDEAHELFAEHRAVRRRLEPLREVGLGYLALGQPTSTLSGGEAQRLKLAAHLAEAHKSERARSSSLLVLDEPTTGLHATDVERLLEALAALLERGASVLVVEHNLDVVARADWVVDLGPEGGPRGGGLVYQGPVAGLRAHPTSLTGAALRPRGAA
jgi:excinuclease ABC subunit A